MNKYIAHYCFVYLDMTLVRYHCEAVSMHTSNSTLLIFDKISIASETIDFYFEQIEVIFDSSGFKMEIQTLAVVEW